MFSSGHLIVSASRKIIFCNQYVADLRGAAKHEIVDTSISGYFSKASNIFIDSYIYPLLLRESVVQESQIAFINIMSKKIPVVVNVKSSSSGNSFWSVYTCENRDILQTELLSAKKHLEKQAQALFLMATTDALTGLLNRREFLNQANKVAHQVERNKSSFALLFIDVDFFKQVNDSFGHQVGDSVLVHVANMLCEGRRINDLVARVGGEEFVLLLADIDEDSAFFLAETIRERIQKNALDHVSVTVSIGLAISHKGCKLSVETLLDLSDQALYRSKSGGRNRTTIADN